MYHSQANRPSANRASRRLEAGARVVAQAGKNPFHKLNLFHSLGQIKINERGNQHWFDLCLAYAVY